MCAMFVDSAEEFLRPTCANCHAPGEAGFCRQCASEALANGIAGFDLVGSFGSPAPEAMASSITSDEVRHITWVDVLDLGLHDLAPPEPDEQLGIGEPELWELLPEAAGAVGDAGAARAPDHEALGDDLTAEWTPHINLAISEVLNTGSLTDSWEEAQPGPGAELWSVVPAEVLGRRSDVDGSGATEGGDGAGVQHVIAGGFIEESEATEPVIAIPEAEAALPGAGVASWSSLQNLSPDVAIRRWPPDGDVEDVVDMEVLAVRSPESQAPAESSCIVCVRAPAVATFVHGLTGHTACCLHCAQEVQRRGCVCPVCRQHFTSVIRNFVAT